eukprot:403331-Prymnesium_polylepis.1
MVAVTFCDVGISVVFIIVKVIFGLDSRTYGASSSSTGNGGLITAGRLSVQQPAQLQPSCVSLPHVKSRVIAAQTARPHGFWHVSAPCRRNAVKASICPRFRSPRGRSRRSRARQRPCLPCATYNAE